MDLFQAMGISASGLQAQRSVIHSISMNLAHVHTTGSQGGESYRRMQARLSPVDPNHRFPDLLSNQIMLASYLHRTHPNHLSPTSVLPGGLDLERGGVKAEIVEVPTEYQMVYNPSHPDADPSGYIYLPDINVVEEMVTLLSAMRAYESNVTAFNSAKTMLLKALEIGR